jgi:hypothetical protein
MCVCVGVCVCVYTVGRGCSTRTSGVASPSTPFVYNTTTVLVIDVINGLDIKLISMTSPDKMTCQSIPHNPLTIPSLSSEIHLFTKVEATLSSTLLCALATTT